MGIICSNSGSPVLRSPRVSVNINMEEIVIECIFNSDTQILGMHRILTLCLLAHLFNGPLPTARRCKNKFSLLMNLTNYYYSPLWLDSARALERYIIIVTNLMLSIF